MNIWEFLDVEKEEEKFQKVYKEMATKMGLSFDPDDPRHQYDWRALYKDTKELKADPTGHFPSKYKEEGHKNLIVDGINTKTGKQVSGGGGSAGALTEEKEEENPLDVLNESIEKNYKEYLKLQKTLGEFDTTLSEIPNAMKPTVIANFNKGVNKFNSLIGTLQTDIAKRDEIMSVQALTQKKQDFMQQKRLEGQEVSTQKTTRDPRLQSSSILDKPSVVGGALGISQPLDLDKINKYVAAPLKGVKHGIYSTPQAIGGLMRMLGENMQATEGTENIFMGDDKKYQDLLPRKIKNLKHD